MSESTTEHIDKLHLKIGGMQCSFCVSSIEKALSQIDGVKETSVSLAHEEVLVQYDPDIEVEQVCAALSKIGHECGGI